MRTFIEMGLANSENVRSGIAQRVFRSKSIFIFWNSMGMRNDVFIESGHQIFTTNETGVFVSADPQGVEKEAWFLVDASNKTKASTLGVPTK